MISLYKSAITGQPVRRGSIQRDDPFYSVGTREVLTT
jgi:hypothetical protein